MCWIALAGVGAAVALALAIDIYRHRHPLTAEELVRLARKRRRNLALRQFEFSVRPSPADPLEKGAMKSAGEFVCCDSNYECAPSRIAGLLKYKKHEWIVIAFIRARRVNGIWWNKGPDGTQVWSFLGQDGLLRSARVFRADTVAIFHNHPNRNPSRHRTNAPSSADLKSAETYEGVLREYGVSLLDFVCERGVPYLYYAAFSDAVVPIDTIAAEIRKVNGAHVLKNYGLRRELRSRTAADRIAGPDVEIARCSSLA